MKHNGKIIQPVPAGKPLSNWTKNTAHSPKPIEDCNNSAVKTEKGKLTTELTV